MGAMGPTVLPQRTGRGTVLESVKSRGPAVPLRSGRVGEVVPLFLGGSLHYARWFRQLRRLQAYTQLARKNSCSVHATVHKVSVWSAIVNAPGFSPSFVEWWEARHVHRVGDVDQVPTQAPSLEVFSLPLKQRQRFQQAKQRRKETARLVFRDIARDQPLPVHVLLKTTAAQVTQVDQTSGELHLNKEVTFEADKPLQLNGQPIQAIMTDTDMVFHAHHK